MDAGGIYNHYLILVRIFDEVSQLAIAIISEVKTAQRHTLRELYDKNRRRLQAG